MGQWLVRNLQEAGYQDIDVIDSREGPTLPGIHYHLGTVQAIGPTCVERGLVIHLAAQSHWPNATVGAALEDAAALNATYELAKRTGSGVLVCMSALMVGGTSPHACYCKMAEALAAYYKQTVQIGFARLFNVYGRGQPDNFIRRALEATKHKTTLQVWNKDSIRDWVHVSDVASALTYIISKYFGGSQRRLLPFTHIGTGRGLPVATALDSLCQVIGREIEVQYVVPPYVSPLVSVAKTLPPGWTPSVSFEAGINLTWLPYIQ